MRGGQKSRKVVVTLLVINTQVKCLRELVKTAKKLESEGSAQALRTRRAIADMLWCRAEAHIKIFESYWQGRDPRRLLNARHGLAVLGECEATGGQERQAK